MTPTALNSTTASRLQVGHWLAFRNARMNQRIVGVSNTPDGQVKVHADFGHGGEPATFFFEKDELVAIV